MGGARLLRRRLGAHPVAVAAIVVSVLASLVVVTALQLLSASITDAGVRSALDVPAADRSVLLSASLHPGDLDPVDAAFAEAVAGLPSATVTRVGTATTRSMPGREPNDRALLADVVGIDSAADLTSGRWPQRPDDAAAAGRGRVEVALPESAGEALACRCRRHDRARGPHRHRGAPSHRRGRRPVPPPVRGGRPVDRPAARALRRHHLRLHDVRTLRPRPGDLRRAARRGLHRDLAGHAGPRWHPRRRPLAAAVRDRGRPRAAAPGDRAARRGGQPGHGHGGHGPGRQSPRGEQPPEPPLGRRRRGGPHPGLAPHPDHPPRAPRQRRPRGVSGPARRPARRRDAVDEDAGRLHAATRRARSRGRPRRCRARGRRHPPAGARHRPRGRRRRWSALVRGGPARSRPLARCRAARRVGPGRHGGHDRVGRAGRGRRAVPRARDPLGGGVRPRPRARGARRARRRAAAPLRRGGTGHRGPVDRRSTRPRRRGALGPLPASPPGPRGRGVATRRPAARARHGLGWMAVRAPRGRAGRNPPARAARRRDGHDRARALGDGRTGRHRPDRLRHRRPGAGGPRRRRARVGLHGGARRRGGGPGLRDAGVEDRDRPRRGRRRHRPRRRRRGGRPRHGSPSGHPRRTVARGHGAAGRRARPRRRARAPRRPLGALADDPRRHRVAPRGPWVRRDRADP